MEPVKNRKKMKQGFREATMSQKIVNEQSIACKQQCDEEFIRCVDNSSGNCLESYRRCSSFCRSMTMDDMMTEKTPKDNRSLTCKIYPI
jgi:hypothetical protein